MNCERKELRAYTKMLYKVKPVFPDKQKYRFTTLDDLLNLPGSQILVIL